MQKFIHNLALLAGLAALSSGLWHGWDLQLTLQRVGVSCLGFFILGGGLVLVVRSEPANRGNEQAGVNRAHGIGRQMGGNGLQSQIG